MAVVILSSRIEPWQVIQEYQAGKIISFGATSIFIGTMRDYNEGRTVRSMTLDYYPGMTEKELERIAEQARQRWRILDSLIIHRVGEINPNETIVVVAVWTSHRGDAFDACRYIMEELKSSAPFWKKERLESGESCWVEKNTDGYLA